MQAACPQFERPNWNCRPVADIALSRERTLQQLLEADA
jgi:hypothetical protein